MKGSLDYGRFLDFKIEASPTPTHYLKEGDVISFGNSRLDVLFTPGHSPASLSFYSEKDKLIISGDVLFYGSVGRFDLPGADGKILYQSLTEKMMGLPDDVKVYSGHGPETTIGFERKNNPYLKDASLFNR
jgi:glyoxylase-like metal-dependent hydrolase (beta-lactamase superfamily II)